MLTINQWELASVYTISDRTYQINFPLILNSNHVRVIVQVSHMFVTRITAFCWEELQHFGFFLDRPPS